MRRLYLRIYLAVLASLVLFALLAGLTWRMFYGFETTGPSAAFFVEAANQLAPPADAPLEAQRQRLQQWHRLSGYDIAIFAPSGRLIAQNNDGDLPSPVEARIKPSARQWRNPFGMHALQLADGRWLVAARPRAERGLLQRFAWLLAPLGIAGAVGIAAYPVVRRLTRGLEQLEASVEALGTGNLSARVTINGRDEVARLAAKFNQSAARIEQLIATNKSLLANASHELRSPLARLRMTIESVEENVPATVRDEFARNIRELDELVEEVLLASRLEASTIDRTNIEAVDLVALIAEECARIEAELAAPPSGGIVIPGDARLLRRLVRNLLENAARYGGGSAIEVAIHVSATAIDVDILDRGPGVPASERERIFEPFYRRPGAREREGSVGLGLSLSRQIAGRHAGRVDYRPRDGGGSCFRFSLPRAHEIPVGSGPIGVAS